MNIKAAQEKFRLFNLKDYMPGRNLNCHLSSLKTLGWAVLPGLLFIEGNKEVINRRHTHSSRVKG